MVFQNKHCCIGKKGSRVHESCGDGTALTGALVLSYTDESRRRKFHDTELRPVKNSKPTNFRVAKLLPIFLKIMSTSCPHDFKGGCSNGTLALPSRLLPQLFWGRIVALEQYPETFLLRVLPACWAIFQAPCLWCMAFIYLKTCIQYLRKFSILSYNKLLLYILDLFLGNNFFSSS